MSAGLAATSLIGGAAGIAGGIYGINKGVGQLSYAQEAREKGYNDAGLQTSVGWTNTVGGGLAVAGGGILAGSAIAGMLGVGAANAWNPVGWALLAAGAIAMIGAAVAETIDTGSDANKIFDQLQAQTTARANQMREETEEELDVYVQYQAILKQTNDLETAKRIAMQLGLATEEELKDSKYDEIDAVKDLVDEFIIQKRRLSDDTINIYEDFSEQMNRQTANFTAEYLNKFIGKEYNIQSGDDTWSVNQYGRQMQIMANDFISQGLISQSGEDLTNGENQVAKHLAWMVKKGLMSHDYKDGNLTAEDYDILFRMGTDKDRRLVGEYMLSQDKYRSRMLADESTQTITGHKYKVYANNASEYMQTYAAGLLEAAANGDKEGVAEYIQKIKLLGITSLDEFGDSKATIQNAMSSVGIDSFRSGLSYVPYDDYLARLHQGEAVITAATASELRGLLGEYRRSHEIGVSIDTIIQTQTATLVNKMDEIIQVMQNDNLFANTSETSSRVKNLFNNMKYMRSSKSFNQ